MSNIQNLSLEDIMGERFGRYSKYIIQERALPDIRDGLKPVQRRILYSMNKDGNTFDKAYRKSAKSVGNVMGNFHPHGDSSIYDAMIRMSQDWKMGEPLIEMHGNNGSMDGDPPAAMRYTEARLSEISAYLLADIEKETVPFAWNFDDTEKEPTVLPASYPNLLVNGSTGISAGYATEIPPHNLNEVIDAAIYMIDRPNVQVEKLMEIIPGPDFPTGAIIQGKDEIKKAYESGRGRIVLRSKTTTENLKAGKKQIIVTEIPYEVNKASLVKKIDDIRLNQKLTGIAEVRDESDRDGLRIAIELKKDADEKLILNYLYKYTDLQTNYNFNMVAIDKMTPRQVGIIEILRSYISHRREIILARSRFDLKKAEKRLHIVEGLIKVLSILDEVVALIRASENKADAKENLKISYGFSDDQAEAIVVLQLYRLTNTDIVALEKEEEELKLKISTLKAIIGDERTLFNVMKRELREVKKKFSRPRRSSLVDQVELVEIKAESLISEEETYVSITRDGYIKRTTPRSYAASKPEELGKKDEDELVLLENTKTTAHLLVFTNLANLIYRPVHELSDIRWKDIGEHLSQTVSNFEADERVVHAQIITDFEAELFFSSVTKAGQIKRLSLEDLKPWRTYKSKSTKFAKLKSTDDRVLKVEVCQEADQIMLLTRFGYALRFSMSEVPVLGAKAAGVKAINLKDDDELAAAFIIRSQEFYLLSQRGALKKMKVDDIQPTSRAKRGLLTLRELKKAPHQVFAAGNASPSTALQVTSLILKKFDINLSDLGLSERTSNGSFIFDEALEKGVKEVIEGKI
ncbi:DNA topoisomerase IV subunit A [Streptococcaceae bacterium ESL0729]|nr:DNA topoisomerase IV subunit A [Streptococcaceae bacterium ESL0729]